MKREEHEFFCSPLQLDESGGLKTHQIKEIMKKRVMTGSPETPIKQAAHLMAEKKIGRVPVVFEGSLVGLVTTTDILRYVNRLG